jgi:hypothetical protein
LKNDIDMSEVDELLKEWAFFFRDRKRMEHCRSIEHRFQPHSEDYAKEGWGDMESSPKAKGTYQLLRALQTHEALMKLPKIQKWALTYAYCYPGLARGLVLRVMKKWVGQRVTWRVYQEQIDIGRFRVYAWLKNG